MLDIFRGLRPPTPHFDTVKADLSLVIASRTNVGTDTWFDGHIRAVNSVKSFQRHDKIADGLRIISSVRLWPEVARVMQLRQEDVTKRVDLIADWRNRIVHEFDVDPTLPGKRFRVRRSDVQDSLSFVGRLVKAVDRVVE